MDSFTLATRLIILMVALTGGTGYVQDMPAEYKNVLAALGKSGDFKDAVLKVNIPRSDLRVTIGERSAPTPFGFGGWLALTEGQGGHIDLLGKTPARPQ